MLLNEAHSRLKGDPCEIYEVIEFFRLTDRPMEDNCALSSYQQQCVSEHETSPRSKRKYQMNRAQSAGSPNAKRVFPKGLSILHMMTLGKLVKPSESVSVLEVYSFELENITWSLLTHRS